MKRFPDILQFQRLLVQLVAVKFHPLVLDILDLAAQPFAGLELHPVGTIKADTGRRPGQRVGGGIGDGRGRRHLGRFHQRRAVKVADFCLGKNQPSAQLGIEHDVGAVLLDHRADKPLAVRGHQPVGAQWQRHCPKGQCTQKSFCRHAEEKPVHAAEFSHRFSQMKHRFFKIHFGRGLVADSKTKTSRGLDWQCIAGQTTIIYNHRLAAHDGEAGGETKIPPAGQPRSKKVKTMAAKAKTKKPAPKKKVAAKKKK